MPVPPQYSKEILKRLVPRHTHFIGVDSDGCVFDTMEAKQKKCFHPLIISHWHLEPIARQAREAAEFVNLYSKWRGGNRFPSLVRTFDMIGTMPGVSASGVIIPRLDSLRSFISSGRSLSNASLEAAVRETNDPELAAVLAWSNAVNSAIERTVRRSPPFPWALKSLQKMALCADVVCVSQTPAEALYREWEETGIARHVIAIAGQELGPKSEHLTLAAGGKYESRRMLMIGDALGDLDAARKSRMLFYPINPAAEDASWKTFHDEMLNRFLEGSYDASCEEKMVAAFLRCLPETPPWRKTATQGAKA